MRRSTAAGATGPAGSAVAAPVGEWGRRAACAVPGLGVFVAWTFTTEDGTPWDVDATAVCWGCPVRTACTAYAESTRPVVGIWGGRRLPHLPVPRPDEATSVAAAVAAARTMGV